MLFARVFGGNDGRWLLVNQGLVAGVHFSCNEVMALTRTSVAVAVVMVASEVVAS